MLDHISLVVADIARARAFYDAALGALGHRRVMEIEDDPTFVASGYGASAHEPAFWIGAGKPAGPVPTAADGQHFAFAAVSRDTVDAFYQAALAAGGRDNGPPGLRPQYHPNYYAAFVIDPDGYHLEAVHQGPG